MMIFHKKKTLTLVRDGIIKCIYVNPFLFLCQRELFKRLRNSNDYAIFLCNDNGFYYTNCNKFSEKKVTSFLHTFIAYVLSSSRFFSYDNLAFNLKIVISLISLHNQITPKTMFTASVWL